MGRFYKVQPSSGSRLRRMATPSRYRLKPRANEGFRSKLNRVSNRLDPSLRAFVVRLAARCAGYADATEH